MRIKKSYAQLVNLGNFENVKIGIELEADVKGNVDEIKKKSLALGKLAKILIKSEVESVKKENEREVDNG